MNILLTGGAGYIGSHTAVALSDRGHTPILFDNFSNSNRAVVDRLARLCKTKPVCIEGDVRDTALLKETLQAHKINAVIHFAAFKSVSQSVAMPLEYYDNNVGGLLSLMSAMSAANLHNLVFSSSCTVYGSPSSLPVSETAPLGYANPYGHSKLMCEQILQNLQAANAHWRFGVLRYFNPVGAHDSGVIGEDATIGSENLMPRVALAALNPETRLHVFGNDYDTIDGTCIRDYIHVMDLAEGHVDSLEYLMRDGSHTVNLGTGEGYSVLQLIQAYQEASQQKIHYDFAPRRAGDVAAIYADASLARRVLGFKARRDLRDMCNSSWRWMQAQATLNGVH